MVLNSLIQKLFFGKTGHIQFPFSIVNSVKSEYRLSISDENLTFKWKNAASVKCAAGLEDLE